MPAAAVSEVIPSARRLIRSLRDLGYDLPVALSDVIDNSIEAAASLVRIDTAFQGEESWVRITDNGVGMTPTELHEAMRFGTRRDYCDEDLGKFGLGLKSASLSQCRRLTVATRTTRAGRIHLAQWDLDHVEESDRWEVLRPPARQCVLATDPLRFRAGTVVLWERLDRVTRYHSPDGRRSETHFSRLIEELSEHLSMTFHRFLGGEARRGRRVTIEVNGQPLEPWDPFSRQERATVVMPPQRLRLVSDGRRHDISVRPFLLPAESAYSSQAAHARAAGPRLWSRQQGLYFYRNDRLIQAGGWNRLRTQDEHTKLARIAVDIPSSADEMFELSVSKTLVRLPPSIRAELAAITSAICKMAENAYRRPHSAPGTAPPNSSPQVTAVQSLVRMVLRTTEEVLRTELAESTELADHLVGRLREMELQFIAELVARAHMDT